MIIVASNNIFRRELTSYILGEAGHTIHEAQDLSELLALLPAAPSAIIADVQLDDPILVYAAVRARSEAPILWLSAPTAAPAPAIAQGGEQIRWPYHPGELTTRLTTLMSHASGGGGRERCVGMAE